MMEQVEPVFLLIEGSEKRGLVPRTVDAQTERSESESERGLSPWFVDSRPMARTLWLSSVSNERALLSADAQ